MKNSGRTSVYDESAAYTYYKTLSLSRMRPFALRCVASIFYNFFFRQYRAAFLPGRVPVSAVDHPLDKKIPFEPSWVTIYLDFVNFWIRVVSFLLRNYGRKAYDAAIDFISSMGKLYQFAAGVYKKNFSTTKRPFYISRSKFLIIHLVDPHLMCIPSLHVMIAIRTYTKFRQLLRGLGDEEKFAPQIEELRQGALAISRAILYIKQHSINCISAALYAMCCFDPQLFTQQDAEAFIVDLMTGTAPAAPPREKQPVNYAVRPDAAPPCTIRKEDIAEIQNHITRLFRRFISEKTAAGNCAAGNNTAKNGAAEYGPEYWGNPLLKFLREMPGA